MHQIREESSSIIHAPNAIFWYRHLIVASFRNESGPKTGGVENRGQISHFLTPSCKIRGGVRENAEWKDLIHPTAELPLVYIWWAAATRSRRLEVDKKSSTAKLKVLRHTYMSGGLITDRVSKKLSLCYYGHPCLSCSDSVVRDPGVLFDSEL